MISGYDKYFALSKDEYLQVNHVEIKSALASLACSMAAATRDWDDPILLRNSYQIPSKWINDTKNANELNLWSVYQNKFNPPGLLIGREGVSFPMIHSNNNAWIEDLIISSGYLTNS